MRHRRAMVVSKCDGEVKQARRGFGPLLQAGVAVAIVMIALIVFLLSDSHVIKVQKNAYYYDMASGTVFVASKQMPPLAMPGGGEAVRAHVFTCGSCSEGQWFIGILETYEDGIPDIAHQRVATPVGPGQTPNWLPTTHPSSAQVNRTLLSRCGKGKPKRCDAGRSIGLAIIPPHSPQPGEKVVMNKPKAGVEGPRTAVFHDAIAPTMPSYEAPVHWSLHAGARLPRRVAL